MPLMLRFYAFMERRWKNEYACKTVDIYPVVLRRPRQNWTNRNSNTNTNTRYEIQQYTCKTGEIDLVIFTRPRQNWIYKNKAKTEKYTCKTGKICQVGVAFMRPRQAESKIVQLLWLNPSPSYHLHVKTMLMIIIICKIMDNETSWWPYYKWLNPSPS